MKKCYFLFMLIVLCSCNGKKAKDIVISADTTTAIVEKPEVASEFVIVPGERVGLTKIDQNAIELDSVLGTPDLSDAAMGKAWLTWYSKTNVDSGKYELNIFTTYKDSEMKEKVVKQIRLTSPDFKLIETGLSTGHPKADFIAKYPDLKPVATYPKDETNIETQLYEIEDGGVAFEFESDYCLSIIVFERDEKVTHYYRTFHPEMKLSNRE